MGLKDKFIKSMHIATVDKPKIQISESIGEQSCKPLEFPYIYRNDEYLALAYRIYDEFLQNIHLDKEMSPKSVKEAMSEFLVRYDIEDLSIKEEIIRFVVALITGYGPISLLLECAGENLNDIIVNTKDYIDIIYKGRTVTTPFRFRSEEELRTIINKMLAHSNRKVDESNPIVSAKLPDGSRFEVQIPPVAANLDSEGNPGSYVTVRRFRNIPFLFEQLIDGGQMDMKMAYFLLKAIEGKLNIIISGGTSSGKTTFLNTLTRFIDESDQLLTIEDTKEMRPQMPCHSVRSFEARPPNIEGKGEITAVDLLRTALRSSPRRIIVGECRGPEIVVMLNAMNTGHPGSMTTIHADDTKEAIVRIENMYLEARPTANMYFIRSQIISAIDLIVQLVRFPDGSRRVVKISEPEKRMEENGVVSILDIFDYERNITHDILDSSGKHRVLTAPPRALAKMQQNGVHIDTKIFHPDFTISKKTLIDALAKYPPSRMCGWRDEYMGAIIKETMLHGKSIIDRWPNLKGI